MKSQIFLFGLDHRLAPVSARETLALTGDGLRLALKYLRENKESGAQEAVILSTCNRLECYLAAETRAAARRQFDRLLEDFYGAAPQIRDYIYEMVNEAAVEHLMRVAAGLEAMILGESQILGQVAQSYSKARSQQTSGAILNRLFEQSIRAGKRARAETEISRHTTSVSHAAAILAHEKLGGLEQAQILLIGAGEMAAQALEAFSQHGARRFVCVSRTLARAEKLTQSAQGRAINWLSLPYELARADLVISATAAPHPILHAANIAPIMPQRGGRPLLMIDIAVPRDIDETVKPLPGVEVYNIDDLQTTLDEHLALRRAAVPQVESIIEEERAAFRAWLRSRSVLPTIQALRGKAQAIASTEVCKTLRSLKGASPETERAIVQLGDSIVRKLLHEPTARLKAGAQTEDDLAYTKVIWKLFALEDGELEALND